MNKKFLMACVLLLVLGFCFAEIAVQNFSEKGSNYTLDIEYFPDVNEVKITYTTASESFKEDSAITIIRDRLIQFQKENGYFHYKFYSNHVTKFDMPNRLTKYTSFVRFSYN